MSAKTEQNLVLFPALKRFPHARVTVNYSILAGNKLVRELFWTCANTLLD